MGARSTLRGALLGAVAVCAAAPDGAEAATLVPREESRCDLAALSLTNPKGVTRGPGTSLAVLHQGVTATLSTLDPATCTVTGTFDTGRSAATGVAFDGTNFAVIDSATERIYFYTPAGSPLGNCSVGADVDAPTGIAHDAAGARFAVVDATEVNYFDRATCALRASVTLPAQIDAPGDVAVVDAARLAIVDRTDLEVYVVDAGLGTVLDSFDTSAGLLSTSPQGLAFDATAQRYSLVDDTTDLLQVVDARGTAETVCPGTVSADVTGIAIHPTTLDTILVDSVLADVIVVEDTTCARTTFDLGGLGITDPSDVAYIPGDDLLVIPDRTQNKVFFVDFTTHALSGPACDTTINGIYGPTGIDYLPDLDQLVITTGTDDAWFVTDRACTPILVRSAGSVESTPASTRPQAIGILPGMGIFVLADSDTDQLYFVNLEGVGLYTIDLLGLGLADVQGVVLAPDDPETLSIVDCGIDDIYRFKLPILTEAQELSGRFCSNRGSMYLYERADGSVTGTLLPDVELFGQFDSVTGALSFGAKTSKTLAVAANVVLPDLNLINLAALGNPVRQLGPTCP